MNLPFEKSDNKNRVKRINDFWEITNKKLEKNVLDCGSGLGVFGAEMLNYNWDITLLDPDPQSIPIKYNGKTLGGYVGTLPCNDDIGKYTLITLNKVLEHIQEIHDCLENMHKHLDDDGYIYLELPDGESALK